MKVIDYLFLRPLSALINGILIGLLFAATGSSQFTETYGRVLAYLLTPV